MAGSHFRLSIIVACVAAAVSWLVSAPLRLFDAVGRFLRMPDGRVSRFLSDLTRGPQLVHSVPGFHPIEPAAYHRNRHEAGLALLGSVRHR